MVAATSAAGLAFAQAMQAATVLTGLGDTNALVPVDHGSASAGTPDIDLSWSGAVGKWDQYAGWPNDDHVYQIDGPGDGTATHTVAFSVSPGWNVRLTSLDVNVWAGGGDTNLAWNVVGSMSGDLGSGVFAQSDGVANTFAIGVTGVGSESLTLNLIQQSGVGSYLAVDNLSFDQVAVPEPSTGLLGAFGLGALALRRRRK